MGNPGWDPGWNPGKTIGNPWGASWKKSCLQTRHLLCLQTRHLLRQQTRHLRSPNTFPFPCRPKGGREAAAQECAAMGWGQFKPLLAEATVAALEPIQSRHRELMADRSELDRVLAEGRDQAEAVADATLNRVREALGFAKRG